MTSPRSHRVLLAWVLRACARHKGGIALLCLLMVVEAAMLAASPWPLKIIVDHILNADPGGTPAPAWLNALREYFPGAASNRGLIAWLVAATIILVAGSTVLGLIQAMVSANVGQKMVYDTAADLFAKLQRLSLAFHSRRSVGDSMRRITGDCASIATIVRDSFLPALAALVMLAVMATVMLRLNLMLTLIAMGVAPLLMLVIRRLTPAVLERGYRYAEAEAGVWSIAERTLCAVPVIQAYSAEARTEAKVREIYSDVLDRAIDLTRAQFHLKILTGLITASAAAALLFVGAREVLAGRLTIGGMLVFLAYLGALYAPMTAIVHAASSASQAAGGAQRILDLLAEEEDVHDAPGAQPLKLSGPPAIRFENVSFAYEPGRPVLESIDLDIQPTAGGRTIALVGASGAGKSTLVSLIARLCDPQQGRVLIGGIDIRTVTLRSLRLHISFLHQETYLFPVSIAENIAYASPGATASRIEAAARAAGAHEFISRLPQGYDTLVGQRGATLSGGERQRIAIARALLKDAPILILDEPTSALDAATEGGLLEALDRLLAGRTTIVIAHRLSTIRNADTIVVLDRGRIIEQGTHQELLARRGTYALLYNLQFGAQARSPGAPGE